MFIDTDAAVTGDMQWLGISDEDLNYVGHVLNFKSSVEMRKIQEEHLKKDRNKIPMLFMMDVIHGFRTIYPIPLALGCSFNPDMVAECSKMAAKEDIIRSCCAVKLVVWMKGKYDAKVWNKVGDCFIHPHI